MFHRRWPLVNLVGCLIAVAALACAPQSPPVAPGAPAPAAQPASSPAAPAAPAAAAPAPQAAAAPAAASAAKPQVLIYATRIEPKTIDPASGTDQQTLKILRNSY